MRGKTGLFAGTAAIFLAALSARAQTAVWTGGGGANTNFSSGANWMGGAPPPNNGTDTMELNQAGNATVTINTAGNVAGIVFEGAPGGYSDYTLGDGGG